MNFEEACKVWNAGELTQAEADQILRLAERGFRCCLGRYVVDGLQGLIDPPLEQVSNRQAPVDEVMAILEQG